MLLPAFPWTYDQLQRYAVLRLFAESLAAGLGAGKGTGTGGALRVLDVGGAAADRMGTGFWLPAAEILKDAEVQTEVTVADVSECGLPGFVKASGTDLPFEAGSFDIVSAFDVLEHIPRDKREAFLGEISRVASQAVLVSCPTKSPGVEQAEALLNAEIKRLYGVEHGMLVEHREYGLPQTEEVDAGLSAAGLGFASFGYGALSTWLTSQVFRSSFLVRNETPRTTEAIDLYWAGQPQAAELRAPFYRRYWIAAKTIGANALADMEAAMSERLKRSGLEPMIAGAVAAAVGGAEPGGASGGGSTKGAASGSGSTAGAASEMNPGSSSSGEAPVDAFSNVERVTRDVLSRTFVSAVVATSGEPALLGACLDTVLTQVVDFDLEVTVWNFERRAETASWLAAHYPQVKIYEGDFMGLIETLRGDQVFLVDERFLPTPDAVSRYVTMIAPESPDSVLAAAAPWRGGFPTSWTGTARSIWKKTKGLGIKAGVIGDTSCIREDWAVVPKFKGWVIGDALFFRRTAIHSRKMSDAPDRNSIFLWEFK